MGDNANATAPFANGCDGCDLACKAACAAVGLPVGVQLSVSLPGTSAVADRVVAGLLNPHPFPLLRPPAHTPA